MSTVNNKHKQTNNQTKPSSNAFEIDKNLEFKTQNYLGYFCVLEESFNPKTSEDRIKGIFDVSR